MKGVLFLIVGIAIGVASTIAVGWNVMPNLMLDVHESALPFDATVTAIEVAAKEHGWMVPKVYDLQQSLKRAGHEIGPTKVISLCQPEHAAGILSNDENKAVTGMMPCRIGVFQVEDRRVFVSKLNVGMMSKMFGGQIEQIMSKVSAEEKAMLNGIVLE